jgi:predicted adenylyl cyclase CyaB
MPTNIEIKAKVRDIESLRSRAEHLSDAAVQTIPQVDTFFATEAGRLKLRELGQGYGQLIYYERPDIEGPKRSDYYVFETHEPISLKSVLSMALGVRGVVRKVRYLYMVGQTRVHLDEVEGLGHFLELEVMLAPAQTDQEGREIAEGLLNALGVEKADLLEGAYIDLQENAAGRAS